MNGHHEKEDSKDDERTPTNGTNGNGEGHESENGEDSESHGAVEQPGQEHHQGNPEQDHHDEDDLIAFDSSEVDNSFDSIIGCIEDIVIGDEFQEIQEGLLENNFEHFDENVEENKLIYTEIYQEYTKTVEDFIEEQLQKRIENFCMKDFLKELEMRKTELEGEVFEMLFTLTDFLAFKEMFVDYKIMKNAGAFDNILSVTTL